MRANKLALWTILLALLLTPAAAFAALAKFGPINPYNASTHTGNGYPRYYMDTNGVAVDLQVPPFGDGATAPTMIYGPVDPANPFSVDIGFDAEVFYFFIIPDRATFDDLFPGNVGRANVNIVIGLEAGFAGAGATVNQLQAVWQRIRLNWRKTAPDGFYKFFHPYGVEVSTALGGDLLFTSDTVIAPQDFTDALGTNPLLPGKIGPFLFQVNPPPQIVLSPIAPPYNKPTDWLGDGVTAATFTGSPLNPAFNKFRIEAYSDATFSTPLNIFAGNTVNFLETNLAVIAGHRYHPPTITGAYDLLLLE